MSLYQYLDTAREQISKGASSGVSMFSSYTPVDETEIRRLLNSGSTRESSQGLRALLTMVADGKDVHTYFGDVVKNVHSTDIKVREMAASLLIMYSQFEPELTLLIVNSVKRMLDDTSPVTRMQALHLVSALRVTTIAPLITHFIEDAANDPSPLVRIACCQAIGKCYELDMSLSSDMLDLLLQMLNSPKQLNGDYRVAGWALATLAQHWPQRIDLLHQLYRDYVPHLAQFDEFCVVLVCRMLVRYCRHYIEGPDDGDCKLLVSAVEQLLRSQSSDVVVEAASVVHYVGIDSDFCRLNIGLRLLSLPRSALVWSNILALCLARPSEFSPLASRIIMDLNPTDQPELRVFAVKCARACATSLSSTEYEHLKLCAEAWQTDQESVRAVLETITSLGTDKHRATNILKWLVKCSTNTHNSPIFVSESLMALRVFVQQQSDLVDVSSILARLAISQQILPSARATLVWMLSTHCTDHPALTSELLRKLLPSMVDETPQVRLQILQLSAKLMTAYRNDPDAFDKRVPDFFQFAIKIAHYDPEIDIRDRARLFASILNDPDNSMANLLLQVSLPAPVSQDLESSDIIVNSASAYFRKHMGVYSELEPWSSEDTSMLRARKSAGTTVVAVRTAEETTKPKQERQVRGKPHVKNMSLEEFLETNQDPSEVTADSGSNDREESDHENDTDGESESESGSESERGSENHEEKNLIE